VKECAQLRGAFDDALGQFGQQFLAKAQQIGALPIWSGKHASGQITTMLLMVAEAAKATSEPFENCCSQTRVGAIFPPTVKLVHHVLFASSRA